MYIQENISLKAFNSFGIAATAQYYSELTNKDDIAEVIAIQKKQNHPLFILGGGSNILLTQNINSWVLHNQLKGIELIAETAEEVFLKVMAGESWHGLVEYVVANNWGGIENLSLIPGNVGAAPIQNIGAYGIELKNVLHEVEAIHIEDGNTVTLSNKDCLFGYRDSIFKRSLKNKTIITAITLRLQKHPTYNISYGAIEAELEKMNISSLSIKAISQAVINIRSSKLPNPAVIGNAGSFFKNPVILKEQYSSLVEAFPQLPNYPAGDALKIPAGWLIEQCGWKGYRKGDAGCYEKQALVLVNYGSATGKDIYDLSAAIIESVESTFNISLEREVNII
jgi:UDP-N-acetylmuramate dehydrogenase